MNKICTQCKQEKKLEEFFIKNSSKDGRENKCKLCKTQYIKSTQKENQKRYYQKNKVERISKNREYELLNYDKVKENHRLYNNKRRKHDVNFRLIDNCRSRINVALKGQLKEKTFFDLIGCSIQDFKLHLEQQFTLKMNWENYGNYWEIDHVIPLSKGGTFYYKNTQPLTITENRKKSNKLT
jgi:5-methylcytosine-specific restriction endonuclease McrA